MKDPIQEDKPEKKTSVPRAIPVLFFDKQFQCRELGGKWIGRGHYRPADVEELEVLQKYAVASK